MNMYIFDINKSLATPGSIINTEFQTFFKDWMIGKYIILVTESEKKATVTQIGEDIWTTSNLVYQLNANIQYRHHGEAITRRGANDRIKADILDDAKWCTDSWTIDGNVIYFGTDAQTITKLSNEWNTLYNTHTIHQTTTYTDTWDILKKEDHGQTPSTTIEVKIKEIASIWKSQKEKDSRYDWESLITSIKTNGLIHPLKVRKISTNDFTSIDNNQCFNSYKELYGNNVVDMYALIDGSHRLRVLKDLYGEDHIIKVDVSNI